MPGDPFKKKADKSKSRKPKKSAPTTDPGAPFKAKAPTAGVSPGAKGGNMQGLIGQPSVLKTPHIQGRHQIPKAKTPAKTGVPSGKPWGRKKKK